MVRRRWLATNLPDLGDLVGHNWHDGGDSAGGTRPSRAASHPPALGTTTEARDDEPATQGWLGGTRPAESDPADPKLIDTQLDAIGGGALLRPIAPHGRPSGTRPAGSDPWGPKLIGDLAGCLCIALLSCEGTPGAGESQPAAPQGNVPKLTPSVPGTDAKAALGMENALRLKSPADSDN